MKHWTDELRGRFGDCSQERLAIRWARQFPSIRSAWRHCKNGYWMYHYLWACEYAIFETEFDLWERADRPVYPDTEFYEQYANYIRREFPFPPEMKKWR